MSRVYTSSKTQVRVVMGEVTEIKEGGMDLVIKANQFNKATSTNEDVEFKVHTGVAVTDVKVGYKVTAIGYTGRGGVLNADAVLSGSKGYEDEGITVLTGFVKNVHMNEEMNQDGTHKVKADGVTQRQPHFDIYLSTKDMDDAYHNHVIKVYNGKTEEGKTTPIERAKKMFGRFDKENNRIRVSVVTRPGQERTWTSVGKDGKEYTNSLISHMGYSAIDVDYIDQEKKKENPAQSKTPAAPALAQPAPKQPAPAAPTQASGFETPGPEMDDEEMFN